MTSKPKFNLAGKRFGRLVASKFIDGKWACHCDCGKDTSVITASLISGKTKSCGCLRNDTSAEALRTHGHSRTLTYRRWRSMRSRCLIKNNKSYPRYGGRGITVSDEWARCFEAFLRDMGECPGPEWTVERKDNDKSYYKDNCRWATRTEQSRNTSRNKFLTFNGKTLCISEWTKALDLRESLIHKRLKRGWTIDEALGTKAGTWIKTTRSGDSP